MNINTNNASIINQNNNKSMNQTAKETNNTQNSEKKPADGVSVNASVENTANKLTLDSQERMSTIKTVENSLNIDYSKEVANFSKDNIAAQSGSYSMSQASNIKQSVINLIR